MEQVFLFPYLEQARNAAIAWLERHGARFGPHWDIEIGRLGTFEGGEVGVSSQTKPFWRLRIDNDPKKGPHYNAEFGEGRARVKAAFCFPATAQTLAKLARNRSER